MKLLATVFTGTVHLHIEFHKTGSVEICNITEDVKGSGH
jgi:hypothetical protein